MDTQGETPQPATRATLGWHAAWALVFLANLIVPLMLAWSLTNGEGQIGMFAAVTLVWALGHLVIARATGWRLILVGGGFCIALSQLCPILQILAGVFGLLIVHHGFAADSYSFAAPAAFLATLLTGAQLLIAAIGCGMVVQAAATSVDNKIIRNGH